MLLRKVGWMEGGAAALSLGEVEDCGLKGPRVSGSVLGCSAIP